MNELEGAAALFRNHDDSVLFVTSQLRARELKMARALRRIGWKVGIVYFRWTPFDPQEDSDFSVAVASPAEAHRVAVDLAPRACHVFSGAIDELVLTFCRNKPCAVVIDLNDVFAPSLFDYCHERFEPTQEALALADGFCARDLQAAHARRADGFRLPREIIFFPEYCWNDAPVRTRSEEQRESPEVRVVSVGTFSLETQGMYDSCYLQLVRMFAGQGIHFHIYPHWSYRRDHHGSPHARFEADFAEFLELQSRSSYVHVHESLSLEALADVLPQYDFGIVSGGCMAFGQSLRYYKPPYLQTCYSGRIADYLDARLPVLVNDEVRFDFQLLRHYGACVDLKKVLEPGFKSALLDRKRDPALDGIMDRAARFMSLAHNAPRLGAFYRRLAQRRDSRAIVQVAAIPDAPAADAGTVTPPPVLPEVVRSPMLVRMRRAIRWLSPRAAKILLPYRAIRMFEVRLHNSLQENERGRATIDALRAAAAALEQRNSGLADTLAARERAFEDLSAILSERDQRIALLEQTLGETRAKTGALELATRTAEQRVHALSEDRDELQRTRDGLQTDLSALRLQLQEAREAIERQRARLDEAEQALTASRLRAEGAEASARGALDHANAMHAMAADLREQLARQEESSARLREELFALDRTAGELRQSVAEAELARAAARADAEASDRANAKLSSDLADLQAIHSAMAAAHSALEQAHAAGEQAHAEREREHAERSGALEDRLRDLHADNARLAEQLRALAQRTDHERLVPAAREMNALVHRLTHQPDESFQALDDTPKLLLACMPKSGSTWMTHVLEETLGLTPMRGYLEADRNEQEIDPMALFQSWGQKTLFVQQHVRYSRILLKLCRAFSTRVVVLTRRLDDVVVSLRDHVERESAEFAMFYTETSWFTALTRQRQFDLIVDHAMPWYLNFYVGWMRAIPLHPSRILHVTYEELLQDSAACVARIREFHGADGSQALPEDLDRREGTRFNQGRIGRGREELTAEQHARLRDLAAPYRGVVDLSALGL